MYEINFINNLVQSAYGKSDNFNIHVMNVDKRLFEDYNVVDINHEYINFIVAQPPLDEALMYHLSISHHAPIVWYLNAPPANEKNRKLFAPRMPKYIIFSSDKIREAWKIDKNYCLATGDVTSFLNKIFG